MDISVRKLDGVQVVKLRGALKLGPPVDELRATTDSLFAEGASQFVLDLTEVPIIDSSGIGLLVQMQTKAKKSGGAVHLAGATKVVMQTLKITALLGIFGTFADVALAVNSFASARTAPTP